MELNDFVVKFANIFEETDPSLITPSTEFKTLDEWSSLLALSLIAMADEEFDVMLKGDDVRSFVTVEDVYKFINSRS